MTVSMRNRDNPSLSYKKKSQQVRAEFKLIVEFPLDDLQPMSKQDITSYTEGEILSLISLEATNNMASNTVSAIYDMLAGDYEIPFGAKNYPEETLDISIFTN